jgi:hypothetical protein
MIDSDDDFDDDKEGDDNNNKKYNFPEFDNLIKDSLDEFNEKIFIKLNWSSPKDAQWCLNKLSCSHLSDVYMLLKSSDFITHDLTEPFDKCEENSEEERIEGVKVLKYYLIIRKWVEISPNSEFRCFVKDNRLVGITQRDCRAYYKFIEDKKEKIIRLIKEFYVNNLNEKFSNSSFVFDVYLKKNDTVVLVDFNPYGDITDTLLFDWNDFLNVDNEEVQFRYVESELNNAISESQYSSYQVPIDVVGGDYSKLLDLVKMVCYRF